MLHKFEITGIMCYLTELFLSSFEIPRIHLPFCLLPVQKTEFLREKSKLCIYISFTYLVMLCVSKVRS